MTHWYAFASTYEKNGQARDEEGFLHSDRDWTIGDLETAFMTRADRNSIDNPVIKRLEKVDASQVAGAMTELNNIEYVLEH